jgi:purine-binding chemotaxis protein CheW
MTHKSKITQSSKREFHDSNRVEAGISGDRQYLAFTLGGKNFGVPLLSVKEIVPYSEPLSVPFLPDSLMGLMKSRGNLAPVLNLERSSPLLKSKISNESRIIVNEVYKNDQITEFAMIVDAVLGVMPINDQEIMILSEPTGNAQQETDIVQGVYTNDEISVILMRPEGLISDDLSRSLTELLHDSQDKISDAF